MKNRMFHRLAAFVMAGAMVVSLAAVPAAATEVEPHEHIYGEDNICTICNQTRPEPVTEDLDTTGTDDTKTAENTGTDVSTDNGGSNEAGSGTDNGGSNEAGSGTDNGGNTGTDDGKENTENSENTGTDNNGNSESAENTQDTENTEENEADKSEGTEGESLTEEEKAAQESAKRVAEVQALIDALPDQIQSDEVAQYQEKVAAIWAILETMTDEEIAQLTGLEKLRLELTTADAVEKPVAMIGETPYATFEEAFNAFDVMTEDVTVSILAPVVFTNDMELNGSYESIAFVGVGDNAKITIDQKAGGDYLESNKVVSFENLTLDKYKADWAQNSGHMGNYFSIQGGTVSYENCKFPNGACTSGGTATYRNCEFSHTKGEYGLWVYDDAHVTVQNSIIDSAKGIKLYAEDETTVTSTLKVESTTFTKNVTKKPAVAITYAASVELVGNTYQNPEGVLELDSGSDANCNRIAFTIKDSAGADISATITAKDKNAENASCGVVMDDKLYLNVKSAVEDAKPGSKVAVLYEPADNEEAEFPAGTELTFPGGGDKPDNIVVKPTIAQVGGVYYDTVQKAIEAVESSGEVVIGSDVALDKPLIIPDGKTVTLNLNGHTLRDGEGCLKEGGPDSLVVVDNGATLTVTDTGTAGKISSSMYGIKLTQDSTYGEGQNTAKLVVNGGTIEAQIFAITGNGRRHNTDITINGGTVIGTGAGIYQPQNGKLTINGGTVKGGTGVEIRSGTLTVTGGVIASTEKEFKIEENGNKNGSTTTGAAVAVVPHITNFDVKVTIENGTLTAPHALHEENVQGSTGKVQMEVNNGQFNGTVEAKTATKFIKGGTFSEPPKEELAKDHFSFEKKPDGTFELKEDPHIDDGNGNIEYIDPSDPSKPVSLDDILTKNETAEKPHIEMGANGAVQNDHTMSGELTMEVNGHKITGTGSISGKLTLKDLNANGTDVILPKGGTVIFQDGHVLVKAEAMTKDGKSVGYSNPIQITYNGHDYTYFLGLGGSNDGKLTIDANGKPTVTGQHYEVKAKVLTPGKFSIPTVYNGDVVNNDFYKNTNSTLQFVTDAPATALQTSYVTVDGKQITDSSYFSVTSGDTAAVTLSNKYLRSLSVGVHAVQIHFLDGQTLYGVFSVRTTSNADLSNPKTGDTIGLSVAVMVLSMTALAVLVPRKKRFF